MLVHLFSSLPLFFYIPFFTHHRHTTIASVFVSLSKFTEPTQRELKHIHKNPYQGY